MDREKEQLFAKTWQIVGRLEQVANTGDFFTVVLSDEPLLITRDAAGKLRGFYNVCRHRAGPPATGCGNRKVFRCAYHGWTYDLEGKLITAPEMEGTQAFRQEDFGLRPIRIEIWAGWIFANLDDSAEPLFTSLGDLPQQISRFGFDRLQFHRRQDYMMACNWKTYIDNYLEGYHLPSVHPGLNRELDYNQYVTELYPRHSKQHSPIRAPENQSTTDRRYRQANGSDVAEYYWIFPNWMLNCYPDSINLNIVLPLGPEKCVAIFEWYSTPEHLAHAESGLAFSHQIQLEDAHICEVVQKNLHSRSYERGRFSTRQEKGVHHFHRLYVGSFG